LLKECAVSLIAIAAVVLIVYVLILRSRLRKRLRREQRVLDELVDMLREFEQFLSHEEQLTALERATFRIRLLRFGIGSGPQGRR
ncbi:MAG: hypothetical protein K2V38_03480, partial [Gemmataceae bacterium]|nr:hypothetical protein [Gemmataceae bacterium]